MSGARSKAAFMAELEPLLDALYLHAQRAALRPDSAGDLVQEAVLIGWRELPRYRAGTSFRAWMFRILVNTVWNDNKRAARQRRLESPDAEVDLVTAFDAELTWQELLADEGRLAELLDERLAAALDGLAPEVRQCLLLRWIEELSYREIADMLRLPAGTVMSHVHRARAELRERLAQLAMERGFTSWRGGPRA